MPLLDEKCMSKIVLIPHTVYTGIDIAISTKNHRIIDPDGHIEKVI